MRGFQTNRGDDAGLVGLLPTLDANAPAVAGFEAGEAVLGTRGDQVVSNLNLVLQKLFGDDRANGVFTQILRAGVALAVAVKAGERIGAAGLESGA